jgi:hypothetical protein
MSQTETKIFFRSYCYTMLAILSMHINPYGRLHERAIFHENYPRRISFCGGMGSRATKATFYLGSNILISFNIFDSTIAMKSYFYNFKYETLGTTLLMFLTFIVESGHLFKLRVSYHLSECSKLSS